MANIVTVVDAGFASQEHVREELLNVAAGLWCQDCIREKRITRRRLLPIPAISEIVFDSRALLPNCVENRLLRFGTSSIRGFDKLALENKATLPWLVGWVV